MLTVRAAQLVDARRLDLIDVDLPDPGDGEVVVQVAACGVCGSNLHDWADPASALPAAREVPGALGHEVAGFVDGELVVVNPVASAPCGRCVACGDGAHWFCRDARRLASYGFAEYMVVPRTAVTPIGTGVEPSVALLVEPVACSVHAIRHAWSADEAGRIDGRSVVVIGAGVLGLAAAAAAKALGATSVAVVARHPHQAHAAEAFGADAVLRDSADDLERQLRRLRPELVVEAVGGATSTMELAAAIVAPRGEVAVLGLFDRPQALDARGAVYRETRLFFPVCYADHSGVHDFAVAIDLLRCGSFPFADLVTHRLPLAEVGAAFETAADKSSGALRVVVEP